MAGGYTHLDDTQTITTDNNTNEEAEEGQIKALETTKHDTSNSTTEELNGKNNSQVLTSPDLPSRDLICVFVVTFDPKEGNLLEWSVPKGVALDGIEFRALISGAHTITKDFIYFRQGDFYGAACYEKMQITSESERGVRMKSVGVIVSHYTHLHPHLKHLKKLVRSVLQQPGHYETLREYFEARRAPSPPPTSWHAPPRVTNGASPTTPALLHPQTVFGTDTRGTDTHGPQQLIQSLGEQLVCLWRASLLCKRILLLSEPPIGMKCVWVHWLSLLGAHTTPGLPSALLRPLYYVSLADLDILADQHSYVACTTEKIFEEKTGIYDIYLDNQSVKSVKKHPAITTITNEDRKRISALLAQPNITQTNFKAFFQELNDNIFSALYRASGIGGTGSIGREEMVGMGLNGREDCVFVKELAATHGFDVSVSVGQCLCCPCVL